MSSSSKIAELKIAGPEGTIFDTDQGYIIPLYQRAFAWEERQLVQLIEDIDDIEEDAGYYIGSLIVSKQGNCFEVVDGQQRLTSLYLLMSCLGMKLKHTLSFACRDKSNYTLIKIQELLEENRSQYDPDRIDAGLYQGIRILKQKIKDQKFDRDDFLKKLERVILYRIEVPEYTDLNRYFEIMNTRGEQLEQHDILKAQLMSYLPNEEEKDAFARIWEACSDMTGYVQMHFNTSSREWIFGNRWQELPSGRWSSIKGFHKADSKTGDGLYIADIVKRDFKVYADGAADREDPDSIRIRFESIIEFPYFLLHVLKVFVRLNSIAGGETEEGLLNELLDDRKLMDSFNSVIEKGIMRGRRISDSREKFSRRFIVCLLRSRFLFDKYIIKREYAGEDHDGQWSLKELQVSCQRSAKRPYYTNTCFIKNREWDSTNDRRTRTNIMIQSALRVSYTSPKVMHWITELLYWLSKDGCANTDEKVLPAYASKIESVAASAVRDNFLAAGQDDYMLGVNTPHIVFNYLDYLIWKSDPRKYHDFEFEFRNSVEHWYPRNPSEGTFEQWKDGVDRFGNLCIIQRNVNSKFSNLSPEAKKSTFHQMIARGSLKLRIMSRLTEKCGSQPANDRWRETVCREHEAEMIRILRKACTALE